MLMGFVLTVVKTVLLEHIVTIVRILHHHVYVILFSFMICSFFIIIKRAQPANMVKLTNGTCGQIDGSCTVCKRGWTGYNCNEGMK